MGRISKTRKQRRTWHALYVWPFSVIFFGRCYLSSGFLLQLGPKANFGAKHWALHSQVQSIEQELKALTVKELRDVLKSSPLNKRGILSQLKRKNELVEYLRDNLDGEYLDAIKTQSENDSKVEGLSDTTTSPVQSSYKVPMSMVKASTHVDDTATTEPYNPRDAIFEMIYDQYPPLRLGECTGIGEQDIRHHHHPIYSGESSQLTGDMDIIFVGTASCTPGVTRGVSCTALRLNWNPRNVHGVPGSEVASQERVFSGGTWVFDCGECTQVSSGRAFEASISR